MRKALLCTTVIFAFALVALAQDPQGSSSSTSPTSQEASQSTQSGHHHGMAGKSEAGGGKTLTGCLSQGSDPSSYKLTNGHYKKGVTVTGSSDLASNVNHEVRLTGSWSGEAASKSAASTSGTESATGASATGERSFNADSVKSVSDTCKAAGGAMSESAPKAKKSKSATPPGL